MEHQRRYSIGYWLGHASLQYGGVGPYALRTISALLTERNPDWHFALLCHREDQGIISKIIADTQQGASVHIIPSAQTKLNSLSQQSRRAREASEVSPETDGFSLTHQDGLQSWFDHLHLDLVHFPTPTPPHTHEHVPYLVPPLLEMHAPYIVTIHDVQELRFPEYFSPAQRAIRAMHNWKVLDQARKVIVSYDHVKEDLLKYFRLTPEKIHVCPISYRSISLEQPAPAVALAYSDKYSAWRPFLLYPAQTWPHKNHARLLQALQRVRHQYGMELRLICTGHANDYQKEIVSQAEVLGLRDAVFFTGVVAEDELAWLYQHTALVVIPTEYEAGSFPLLEAMMQGAPVICSDVTSLPETIVDQRFMFSPYDTEVLSVLIFRMLTDASLREENIINGARQTARLRSINAAPYFYDTYRSLLAAQ